MRIFLVIVIVAILLAGSGGLPASAARASAPGGLYYYSIPGVEFNPEANGDPWYHTGPGCVRSEDTDFFKAGLHVPDGAVLKGLVFAFYNATTETFGAPVYLYAYSLTGGTTLVVSLTGPSGSVVTGYGTTERTIDDVVVDNLNNTYVLVWGGQAGQELCSIKVAYTLPSIFGVALPVIQRGP
jgi:hypothetical protein